LVLPELGEVLRQKKNQRTKARFQVTPEASSKGKGADVRYDIVR